MKNIFISILFILIFFSFANADSDNINDYTLIDCVNWDNDEWEVFNSSLPYATLKVWIEKTIDYINNNINKNWNEKLAKWLLFNIKINCSFNDILNPNIDINYNGIEYDNELLIEWVWENSFIVKNIDFRLWYKAWNIIFKNAYFLNENKAYFHDYIFQAWTSYQKLPFTNWIKIIDSYIKLDWNNIGSDIRYQFYEKWYKNYYNYSNKQYIENSVIDIEIDKNFVFKLPIYIKNSKINFNNKNWTWSFKVTFLEDWNSYIDTIYNYSVFISNEIDLWWNNYIAENTTNITFLNNKFYNFKDFDFWWEWIYINNSIENNSVIDISNSHNLYNNILKSWFIDTYDIFNYRKNYSLNNVLWKWFGWIYKRIRDNKYFNIDINSSKLYKEITGSELVKWLGDIYIIFNY